MAHGDEPVRAHDLSSLRILASTGEPWNEAPWRWYFDVVGGGRCPVINISGGTEVGACFLSPHVVQPLSPCSLGGPALGMAVDVFDDAGRLGARRGRRARVHEAVAGHDARAVPRPAALPRDVLVALARTCGGTATSRASTPTGSGSCTAAPTTRSSSRASGSGRPRSRRSSSRIPRCRGRRGRCARRAEGRGAVGVRRARARASSADDALRAELARCVADALGPSFKPAAGAVHRRAAEDAQRQGAAARDPRGRHRRRRPATSPASKTRPRSTRSRHVRTMTRADRRAG